MLLSGRLQAIIDQLGPPVEWDHFLARLGVRNPQKGRGLGAKGIRAEELARCYSQALNSLYDVMIQPPFSRRSPLVGAKGRTWVYVFEISELTRGYSDPFMDVDFDGAPYIALPCRYSEPKTDAELQRAAASAVHEATHVFNCTERHIREPHSFPWRWFDEGTAVYMEMVVLANNLEPLRFAMDWSDQPEVPLDHESAHYQAGMFVCYLAEKMGQQFISKVWMESDRRETPLNALVRLVMQEQGRFVEFSSSDPTVRDLFGSGYCMDSYFVWDWAPEVYERYRERAITESFVLGAGDSADAKGRLDHLACRYYRFFLNDEVTQLQIDMQTPGTAEWTPLKAELAIVNREMQRLPGAILQRDPPTEKESYWKLRAHLSDLNPHDIDHIVLVVSNCGLRAEQFDAELPHDDGQRFSFTIQVA